MKDIPIKPVRVEIDGGHSRVLQTVSDLGEFLLAHWPTKSGGVEHYAARLGCLEAFEGKQTGDDARIAFIRACAEAGIFVFPDSLTERPKRRPKTGRGRHR